MTTLLTCLRLKGTSCLPLGTRMQKRARFRSGMNTAARRISMPQSPHTSSENKSKLWGTPTHVSNVL